MMPKSSIYIALIYFKVSEMYIKHFVQITKIFYWYSGEKNEMFKKK